MRGGGWAALRFNHHDYSLGTRVGGWEYEQDRHTAYGYTPATTVAVLPTAAELDLMDTTAGWLAHIPHPGRRRAVALRCLYDADSGRCVVPLRHVAWVLGITVSTVHMWHARGLWEIACAVNRDARAVARVAPCLRWVA